MPLLGQSHAIELLASALKRDRIAPGYLFVGPDGVGRRLVATWFAEQLLAGRAQSATQVTQQIRQRNHPDLLWVEPTFLHQGKRLTAAEAAEAGVKRKAPPQIRLEQIREVATFLGRPPLAAERSLVVLEAADSMAEAAANGLLKTLEEPGRATLILIAPTLEALLPTLVSRCQRIPFVRLSETDLATVLQKAGQGEILQQPEVLRLAQGSPGAAIAHWQQLQAIPPDLLAQVAQPPQTLRQALSLAAAIPKTLDSDAQLWLVDYLQHCYWRSHPSPILLQQLETVRRHLRSYVQPRLAWEVAFMTMAQGHL